MEALKKALLAYKRELANKEFFVQTADGDNSRRLVFSQDYAFYHLSGLSKLDDYCKDFSGINHNFRTGLYISRKITKKILKGELTYQMIEPIIDRHLPNVKKRLVYFLNDFIPAFLNLAELGGCIATYDRCCFCGENKC